MATRSTLRRPHTLAPDWRLPPGRHGLPRELVSRHQQERLVFGIAKAVAEDGYGSVTIEHVSANAMVSRSTFYQHFKNKQECVLFAHDVVFERLLAVISEACAAEERWELKVKAAVRSSLEFLESAPYESGLLTLDTLGADVEVGRHVLGSYDRLAELLRTGRDAYPSMPALAELTERAVISSMWAVIAWRLWREEGTGLADLEPLLVQLALTPYLGPERAAAVAADDPADGEGGNGTQGLLL